MKRIITVKTEAHRREVLELVHRIPLTGSWSISFKETDIRSVEQNAKMWGMLQAFSDQLVWHGFKLAKEEWKDFFTAGMKQFKVVPNMTLSGFIAVGGHTSTMTKKEMSELIELMTAFGAEHNVKFPARPGEEGGE